MFPLGNGTLRLRITIAPVLGAKKATDTPDSCTESILKKSIVCKWMTNSWMRQVLTLDTIGPIGKARIRPAQKRRLLYLPPPLGFSIMCKRFSAESYREMMESNTATQPHPHVAINVTLGMRHTTHIHNPMIQWGRLRKITSHRQSPHMLSLPWQPKRIVSEKYIHLSPP